MDNERALAKLREECATARQREMFSGETQRVILPHTVASLIADRLSLLERRATVAAEALEQLSLYAQAIEADEPIISGKISKIISPVRDVN